MNRYLVGGAVRDEIMGHKSKDLDYVVVLPPGSYADPFEFMAEELEREGYTIFVRSPEFFTVRAQTPDKKETADFVLAREEGPYTDGRRPDWVKPGTLLMDQQRRDFTMNAIAKDEDGSYIDPFNGRRDIGLKLIRAVGDPMERLSEDALRAVRALRFAVTKGFVIERDLSFAMQSFGVLNSLANKISDERIQVELSKMFRYDTSKSLSMLNSYPALSAVLFSGKVSLDATLKTKGRGK